MFGSFRLGRLFGVPVYLHWTFLILIGLIGLTGLFRGGPVAAFGGVALIASVFGFVVLHEYGHVLAARRYGIPTRDVTLLPIGGVARLERMPEKPSQELVVALAGPAVNVALAALLFPLIGLGAFVAQLFAINVVLAVFNLLPAFPMDGGRVLRALLARRMSYVRATDLAASIGKGMAILLAFAGLLGVPGLLAANPMLLLVAWFVWSGAGREALIVRHQHRYGRPVGWRVARSSDESDVLDAEVVWTTESGAPRPRGPRHDFRAGPWRVVTREWVAGDDGTR